MIGGPPYDRPSFRVQTDRGCAGWQLTGEFDAASQSTEIRIWRALDWLDSLCHRQRSKAISYPAEEHHRLIDLPVPADDLAAEQEDQEKEEKPDHHANSCSQALPLLKRRCSFSRSGVFVEQSARGGFEIVGVYRRLGVER